jgi:hypothetical protein
MRLPKSATTRLAIRRIFVSQSEELQSIIEFEAFRSCYGVFEKSGRVLVRCAHIMVKIDCVFDNAATAGRRLMRMMIPVESQHVSQRQTRVQQQART